MSSVILFAGANLAYMYELYLYYNICTFIYS